MDATPVTIAEEIVLLALDAESGSMRYRQAVGWAAAGAVLLELSMNERVRVDGKKLVLADASPIGTPVLDESLRWLAGKPAHPAFRAPTLSSFLTREATRSVGKAQQALVDKQAVRRESGLFTSRHPVVDTAMKSQIRARVDGVVLGGEEPGPRTGGIVSLLDATKLYRVAFPDHRAREVKPRMKEIADGEWAAEGVKQAVAATAAAIAATLTVAAVAAGGA